MPVLFYAIIGILFFASFRFKRDGGALDKNSSNSIKGLCLLLIVVSHILNAFPYENSFMSESISYFRMILGQLCVTMFFFISGYGIILSTSKNGAVYGKSLFTNRVLRIMLYSVISIIPYVIFELCTQDPNEPYDAAKFFGDVFGAGNSSGERWFIFAILICYASCAVVFLFNIKKMWINVILISACVLTYILCMYFCRETYSHLWDTIVAFIYGMVYALFKDKVNAFFKKGKWIPALIGVSSLGITIALQLVMFNIENSPFPLFAGMWFTNLFYSIFWVSLTAIFTLKSYTLSYIGKASFAIFVMHMLVVKCFLKVGVIPNEHWNYIVMFIAALGVGIPVHYIFMLTDKYVTDPIVKWNRNIIRER